MKKVLIGKVFLLVLRKYGETVQYTIFGVKKSICEVNFNILCVTEVKLMQTSCVFILIFAYCIEKTVIIYDWFFVLIFRLLAHFPLFQYIKLNYDLKVSVLLFSFFYYHFYKLRTTNNIFSADKNLIEICIDQEIIQNIIGKSNFGTGKKCEHRRIKFSDWSIAFKYIMLFPINNATTMTFIQIVFVVYEQRTITEIEKNYDTHIKQKDIQKISVLHLFGKKAKKTRIRMNETLFGVCIYVCTYSASRDVIVNLLLKCFSCV
ncbi:hypothetical protein Bhyg_06174 [Pseudolycoriella hygida]|uniref:Uncharacterized protein n=1 Tax=Pseudolycoriella hygida TaxID=35572 RepID=A0A9Q0N0C2_9DIPT|nr:hypothetical protein Bhyg_06174 [Pseudolycoriella hygida]